MQSAKRDMRAALQSRVVLGDRPQLVETPGEHAMPGARFVAVGRILPNPHQPRKHFDSDSLDELAASVRERGIMQPLVVRPAGDNYAIVMGERRYRAALLVGLETVPVVVRDITDEQAYFDALIENLQREDLTDEEEAEAYRGLIARGLSVRKIAESLGIAASIVSRMVRVYEDEILSTAVIAGQITKSQAQEMLAVSPEGKMHLVQFVMERQKNRRPVRLPDLRKEVEGIQRPSVALRNTQVPNIAPQPFPVSDLTETTIHGSRSLTDARQKARALRQTIEAQFPLLLAFMQDEEVATELEIIHRVIVGKFGVA